MFLTTEAEVLGIVVKTANYGCCEDMNVTLQLASLFNSTEKDRIVLSLTGCRGIKSDS